MKKFKIDIIDTFLRIMKTNSGKIAYNRTKYVLKISLLTYIPSIILCLYLFVKYNYMSLPIWLLIILSTFPFTKYVLIPLSEKHYFKIKDKKVSY